MTNNETILTFLIDKINWNDEESVDYCFELAFKLDLSYMVDSLLDRLNEVKNGKEIHSEASWQDAATNNQICKQTCLLCQVKRVQRGVSKSSKGRFCIKL